MIKQCVLMVSTLLADDLLAQRPAPPTSSALFEYQVEHPATLVRNAPQPTFPPARKAAGIEGEVIVTFIVDTLGAVEPRSVRTVSATDKAFEDAVLGIVPLLRFEPAVHERRPVRQVVQQTFVFALAACEVAKARPKGCLSSTPRRPPPQPVTGEWRSAPAPEGWDRHREGVAGRVPDARAFKGVGPSFLEAGVPLR